MYRLLLQELDLASEHRTDEAFFPFTLNIFTCKLGESKHGLAMRVLIIADDLTGALDSAVTLTGAGLRCVVARRPGDVAAALASARRPQRQHRLARGWRGGGAGGGGGGARRRRRAAGDRLQEGRLPPQGPCGRRGRRPRRPGRAQPRPGRPGDPGAGPDRRGRPPDRRRGRRADRRGGGGGRSGLALEVPDTRSDADFDAALAARTGRAAGAARRSRRAGGRRRAPARGGRTGRSRRRGCRPDPARDRLARSDHPRPGRGLQRPDA